MEIQLIKNILENLILEGRIIPSFSALKILIEFYDYKFSITQINDGVDKGPKFRYCYFEGIGGGNYQYYKNIKITDIFLEIFRKYFPGEIRTSELVASPDSISFIIVRENIKTFNSVYNFLKVCTDNFTVGATYDAFILTRGYGLGENFIFEIDADDIQHPFYKLKCAINFSNFESYYDEEKLYLEKYFENLEPERRLFLEVAKDTVKPEEYFIF